MKTSVRLPLHCLAAILALPFGMAILAVSSLPASAEGTELTASPAVGEAEALQGAIDGTSEGLAKLRAWLEQAGGRPKATSARAIALIKALRPANGAASPDLQQIADRIAQSAERILRQVHIVRTSVATDVALGEGRLGFVFQTPDAKSPPGFDVILPRDPRLRGSNPTALRSPVDAPILRAGIVGVEAVTLKVPNGTYRLILLTSDMGLQNLNRSPFGTRVRVNDQTFEVATVAAADWRGAAAIGHGATRAADGGSLILPAAVRDGTLTVSFLDPLGETFISGLILEPLAQRSLLAGAAESELEVADADAAIDDAVGALLSEITTAAGPQALANNLQLNNPPAPPPDTLSAN